MRWTCSRPSWTTTTLGPGRRFRSAPRAKRAARSGGGDPGFGDVHAYHWSAGTSFDLGTLGGKESAALAVSRRGQVAGHSRVGGAVANHGFVLAEAGTMVDVGSLGAAGTTSIAHD